MGGTRVKQICSPPPPRYAAVALTVRDGSGFTYRNAMSVVRREIKLPDLVIAEVNPRSAVTGAFIFEIAGQDASSKASRLAEKMAGALRDFPAKITVPRKTAELMVTGLEDSITSWWQSTSPRRVAARPRMSTWALYAPLLGASARCGCVAR
jgi:hypothetical protein